MNLMKYALDTNILMLYKFAFITHFDMKFYERAWCNHQQNENLLAPSLKVVTNWVILLSIKPPAVKVKKLIWRCQCIAILTYQNTYSLVLNQYSESSCCWGSVCTTLNQACLGTFRQDIRCSGFSFQDVFPWDIGLKVICWKSLILNT